MPRCNVCGEWSSPEDGGCSSFACIDGREREAEEARMLAARRAEKTPALVVGTALNRQDGTSIRAFCSDHDYGKA